MRKYFLLLTLLIISIFIILDTAMATKYYCIRPSNECKGDNSGSDWNNAKPIPFEYSDFQWRTLFWERDAVYYVADGIYTGLILFNATTIGTELITWKKATISDHYTDTGWNEELGDGVAEFRQPISDLLMIWWIQSDYWIFDGQVGEGGNKEDYGFYIVRDNCTNFTRSDLISIGSWGTGSPCHLDFKHIALTNCDCSGEEQDWDIVQNCVFGAPQTGRITDVNFSYCFMEKAQSNMLMYKWDNSTIEHCYFNDNWSTSAPNHNHGQQIAPDNTNNIIFRFNTLKNTSVGGIAYHQRVRDVTHNDNWQVYGNIAFNTDNRMVTMGIFGNGDTRRENVSINCKYYNNSFANITGGMTGIYTGESDDGGTGNVAYNNLWYNCDNPRITGGINETETIHDYNAFFSCSGVDEPEPHIQTGSEVPFIDPLTNDFHLKAETFPGLLLPIPYNEDFDGGELRGVKGVWDRGAYEYNSIKAELDPPRRLRVVNVK